MTPQPVKLTDAEGAHWDDLPDLLTPAHVAAILHVSTKTANRILADIPHATLLPRVKRWRKEDVQRFLNHEFEKKFAELNRR